MQVLLRSDVDHLGYSGDLVEVKRGYWRNYLRPRGLAETATADKVRDIAARMERRRAMEASDSAEAQVLKELLDRTTVTVAALATPQGTLFGSVGGAEISRSLEATRKLRLDPKKVDLDEPLKAIGTFEVPVDLGHGVKAELTVVVEESKLSAQELARVEAEKRTAENAAEAARLKSEGKTTSDVEAPATSSTADEAEESVSSANVEA